jgi:hypothetical protein
MATIYNHENYEITIDKKLDSVYVSFLDKTFYKLFEYNFLDTDVIQFKMNLDNFYKIIIKSFDALIDEDKETATIKINHSSRNINIIIHYTDYLEFNFELILNLNTDSNMSTKDLCIKKLEQKLDTVNKSYTEHIKSYKKLEQKFNQLEKFIDEFIELTINFSQAPLTIKMNTPIIELNINPSNKNIINYSNNVNDVCIVQIFNGAIFNTNFKMIKCHTLTINNMASNHFNYANLPLSITKLIIKGNTATTYFTQMDLPNLETIQLEQSTITAIHSSISHLKSVKTIRVTGCTSFIERELLLTNGYIFESY